MKTSSLSLLANHEELVVEDPFTLHLNNLSRCGDKRSRDDYLFNVERTLGSEYRQRLSKAWFDQHTSEVEKARAQFQHFNKPRV